MRLVALTILMSTVCVVSLAHASNGSPGPTTERDATDARSMKPRPRQSLQLRATKAPANRLAAFPIEEPATSYRETSSTVETIKSLANGDSLVNPWVPGRGAIGVNVKVTW